MEFSFSLKPFASHVKTFASRELVSLSQYGASALHMLDLAFRVPFGSKSLQAQLKAP
jgi:hypothetical protein